ncbi:MAG TPA: thioredoxin-like domain-containing protein [Pirellulales bacterium]|nr:thioredoxin-like domain-containing protein [Pirellulales bacterium]
MTISFKGFRLMPHFPGWLVLVALVSAWLCGSPAETAQAADKPARKQTAQKAETREQEAMPEGFPYQHRIPCPELAGGVGWLNTAGPLELKDLRGKFVLMDFWTFCCINCMHILPELKKLEAAYPRELVVIGVHSAKFENEEDTKNIAEAIQRYDIEHPVINDARHAIWNRFGINSWPSVLLIDPEGNLVWGRNGEVEFKQLDQVIKAGLPYYRRKGVLNETLLRFDLEAHKARNTPLRYPGKILADAAGQRLFVADSNHHRIIVADLGGRLITTIGSGELGVVDGPFDAASFNHPQGMAVKGDMLYVADTENHLLRKVDLKAQQVTTIAGTGQQRRSYLWPGMPEAGEEAVKPAKAGLRFAARPRGTALNSPWDLCIHDGDLYIAMAGPHQIWRMSLDEREIGPYAGNGREDIVDGPLLPSQPYEEGYASFAQPSGLTTDGSSLYVADSEGSSIRAVPFKPTQEVKTVIGTSQLPQARLFTFGDVDGKGSKARLQHCLGVAYLDGQIYVADTYNNKIKVLDPKAKTCRTIAGDGKPGTGDEPAQFDEPAGISAADGRLYVADTNNHLIRVVDLKHDNRVTTLAIEGLTAPQPKEETAEKAPSVDKTIEVPAAALKPDKGQVHISVSLDLPDGYKINPEAPMAYRLESQAKEGVLDRKGFGKSVKLGEPAPEFKIDLPLAAEAGTDQLKLSLAYYYCQDRAGGLCKVGTVAWKISFKLDAEADASTLPLDLEVK